MSSSSSASSLIILSRRPSRAGRHSGVFSVVVKKKCTTTFPVQQVFHLAIPQNSSVQANHNAVRIPAGSTWHKGRGLTSADENPKARRADLNPPRQAEGPVNLQDSADLHRCEESVHGLVDPAKRAKNHACCPVFT